MAISYVGGQKGSFAGKTSATTVTFALTGGLASVPAADDLVIVAYAVGSSGDVALTIQNASAVNYTLIGSELYQNDTYDSNLRVAYRFMPATPETTMVLSGTGNNANAGAYTIHVFRGVDLSTPLDVAAVTAGNINTRLANPGSILPTTSGSWIYVVGAAACAVGGTFTAAYLTDLRAQTQADTIDVNIGSGYVTWSSGTYDPAAFGGGGTDTADDSWTAVTAALRPASASPQTITAGAPALTTTAPAMVLSALATLLAGTLAVVLTAPAAILDAGGGAQTLVAGAPVLALSAPATTLSAEHTLGPVNVTITTTAPTAILAPETVLVSGAPSVTVTAPAATIQVSGGSQTLEAGSPVLTLSAPAASIDAPASSVKKGLRRGALRGTIR